MGRCAACVATLWTRIGRGVCQSLNAQCWLHVDDVQLHLQRRLRVGHAEADKVNELQRL